MKGKISLLVGGAAGYVLGTRAGRERYEQIKSQAQSFWGNPKVQEKASQAQDFAKDKVGATSDDTTTRDDTVGGTLGEEPPYPTNSESKTVVT